MQLTGKMLKSARILLELEQRDIVVLTELSITTIRRMESDSTKVKGARGNVLLYKRALEERGIEFFENEKGKGILLKNKEK